MARIANMLLLAVILINTRLTNCHFPEYGRCSRGREHSNKDGVWSGFSYLHVISMSCITSDMIGPLYQ